MMPSPWQTSAALAAYHFLHKHTSDCMDDQLAVSRIEKLRNVLPINQIPSLPSLPTFRYLALVRQGFWWIKYHEMHGIGWLAKAAKAGHDVDGSQRMRNSRQLVSSKFNSLSRPVRCRALSDLCSDACCSFTYGAKPITGYWWLPISWVDPRFMDRIGTEVCHHNHTAQSYRSHKPL